MMSAKLRSVRMVSDLPPMMRMAAERLVPVPIWICSSARALSAEASKPADGKAERQRARPRATVRARCAVATRLSTRLTHTCPQTPPMSPIYCFCPASPEPVDSRHSMPSAGTLYSCALPARVTVIVASAFASVGFTTGAVA